MKTLLLILSLLFWLPSSLDAQALNRFRWKSRLVLCFTPEPSDPLFQRQVKLLYDEIEAMQERDVIFIFVTPEGNHENTGRFSSEADAKKLYEQFSVAQYQFELILIGYDGYEKYRARNRVTPPIVLANMIDEMPMRKRELLQGYGTKSTSGG